MYEQDLNKLFDLSEHLNEIASAAEKKSEFDNDWAEFVSKAKDCLIGRQSELEATEIMHILVSAACNHWSYYRTLDLTLTQINGNYYSETYITFEIEPKGFSLKLKLYRKPFVPLNEDNQYDDSIDDFDELLATFKVPTYKYWDVRHMLDLLVLKEPIEDDDDI